MASAYDKLTRILNLEKSQGCRDRAVIGGLGRFLGFWVKEAREEPDPYGVPSPDEVAQALDGYADMTPEARRKAMEGLLERLAQRPLATPVASETLPTQFKPDPAPQAAPKPSGPVVEDADDSQDVDAFEEDDEAFPRRKGASEAPPRPRRDIVDSSASLSSPVVALRGVSTVTAERLERLGLHTIRDLLYHLPRHYDDFSKLQTINHLALDDEVTIAGVVRGCRVQRMQNGRTLVRVAVSDGTGTIELVWFNQPYLDRQLTVGREIVISGKVSEHLGRLVFSSPEWEPLQREQLHTKRLVPVYGLTEGIHMRWLRKLLYDTLAYWAPRITDPMPQAVLATTDLPALGTALEQIHFPSDKTAVERARLRLCFDEFFLLQLGLLKHRHVWRTYPGRAFSVSQGDLDAFLVGLPFSLTGAQRRAVDAVLADLQQPVPMSRLLQGDVGSGKTVVAAAAILTTVRNGLQAAVMAPTSILAEQHYRTLSGMLGGFPGIRCALLIGSLPDEEKTRLREEIAAGRIQVVVGTHALIQESVEFAALGLTVVDEEHRFGVEQRGMLRAKGNGVQPHLLAMSATPIPRTLALTVYGDLDVTTLDEMPPNRQEIITAVRDRHSLERIYAFMRAQIREGRQAFVICPLVEESDKIDASAAVEEYERLRTVIFPNLRVGLLHGRLAAEEKERAMEDFAAGRYDILVSTAVVEVGIDVPNASVILVEGAERFGLAQLHQFRGRVGRGEWKSYCILVSDDPSEENLERLRIVEDVRDGFELAEKDLAMRGPGDFFGVRQHGLPMLKIAQLSDSAALEMARAEAQRLYAEDPELSHPEHQLLAASVRHFWTDQILA
ncbi:MAG: ATP-dependent DNA helicase RecG [Anaerolineae bacterium]